MEDKVLSKLETTVTGKFYAKTTAIKQDGTEIKLPSVYNLLLRTDEHQLQLETDGETYSKLEVGDTFIREIIDETPAVEES